MDEIYIAMLLGALVLAALVVGITAVIRSRQYLSAVVIYLAGILIPLYFVSVACSGPASYESCGWGMFLLPPLWAASFVCATLVYLLWLAAGWGFNRMMEKHRYADD